MLINGNPNKPKIKTMKTKPITKLPVSWQMNFICATKIKTTAYLEIIEKTPTTWKQFDVIFKRVNN